MFNLPEIEIPDDSDCYAEDNIFKANKFIIKNMKPIADFNEWYDEIYCLKNGCTQWKVNHVN